MQGLRIPVAQPWFGGNEKKYVNECLDSGWISSLGEFITRFEQSFANYVGVKHAISTNNGTTALHVALLALGVKQGDEVIIPTVTYIATANAVSYCGAIPVLVDVDPLTMNILPGEIESKLSEKTVGIIAVHLYGHPAPMTELSEVAERNGLWILEDAAEAHGARVAERSVGSIGKIATFSFFGNKIMTTGEGGMVTTNDDYLAERVRLLKGQGMDPKRRYWFPEVGYNYRMTNIQAAIGLAQLETIDSGIEHRRQLAGWYNKGLKGLEQLILPKEEAGTLHTYWMYTVFLNFGGEPERDELMKKLDTRDIETRPVFYPMHVLPPYRQEGVFPNADLWAGRGINLPTHQGVSQKDAAIICETLAELI